MIYMTIYGNYPFCLIMLILETENVKCGGKNPIENDPEFFKV